MYISTREYAKGHLEEITTSTGIEDWFAFLDSPTRLTYLLRIAKPVIIKNFKEDSDCLYWNDVGDLVTANGYGLWPNPTKAEMFVAERVWNLSLLWVESGCWSCSDTDEAFQMLEMYNEIASYDIPDELYHTKVVNYQSSIGATETVEAFERSGADFRLAWGDWYYSKKASRFG